MCKRKIQAELADTDRKQVEDRPGTVAIDHATTGL
jgi:hypothetical protein